MANGAYTWYGYTAERGLLNRVITTPLTGQGLDVAYTRDLKGRITLADSSVNTEDWAYSYDALGRLAFADNASDNAQDRWFNYDLADKPFAWLRAFTAQIDPPDRFAGAVLRRGSLFNTAIGCGAWPQNITYPAQGVASGRPHAPTAICGRPVTYDANG